MGPARVPIADRFWQKVDKTESCWLWTAGTTHDGYPFISESGGGAGKVYAHRWTYEQLVGPIPEGLHLDHLCRVRHCVNPSHLEPVSPRVNFARSTNRGAQAAVTDHCWRGHSLADAYISPAGSGVRRQCRQCTAIRGAQRWARLSAERAS